MAAYPAVAIALCFLVSSNLCLAGDALRLTDTDLLVLPTVGSYQLRILSPTLLELTFINSKNPDPAPLESWNFVDSAFEFHPPPLSAFVVKANSQPVNIQSISFKRRPLYAPLVVRDLRIQNNLYLELASPIANGQSVAVENPDATLWGSNLQFTATMDPLRFSPALHVNQEGYAPALSKKAMVGYFLGSGREMNIAAALGFKLVDAQTGADVFQGSLALRPDVGYEYAPTPYQKVLEADFTSFTAPGKYRLTVPGLGASLPFSIHDGVPLSFARAYALGLYHQRCGTSNALPFTRFTHRACHTAPANVPVPESDFGFTWYDIAYFNSDFRDNPRHTAPQLQSPASSLYPFVRQGRLDVSGGHHDAGDYSKYTINSAGLIHDLMFAVDSFPGVAALDNLGLPESGDGISDIMQEAKWETDFLAKLQDTDGGFYFLVYPRERDYENNVLPDDGDPQVVWPKTTAVTAAAVAALAQTASSPRFKQYYPATASVYLQKAQLGWKFLTNAIALHGKDGSYQKITHYGDKMMHNDELAWAACEMFVATGHPSYQQKLIEWFNPSDPDTWQYGWWHMFESYGCAIRSFAFAARSGKLSAHQLDPVFLAKCEAEIFKSGNDTLLWAQQTAYGSSFPSETKRFFTAGFYFSSDQAFDITVACQLDPRADYLQAIVSNMNYEGGCNPVNVTFVTGLGAKRQREIVHQFAQNDARVLPQSGLPLGNIQSGFDFLDQYGLELGNLCFPSDGADSGAYPFYDRWGDSFNVTTEFVVLNQARSLASLAFLATLTSAKTQAWVSATGQITVTPTALPINMPVTATFQAPGLNLSTARIVWEARDQQPVYGSNTFTFVPVSHGTQWVEVEAQWPDGRRVFAAANFLATNNLPSVSIVATDANAAEWNADPGVFTFTRSGNLSNDLRVYFQYGGTATVFDDYRTAEFTVPESVLISAGATTATLAFYPIDDAQVEGPESVSLTLQPDPAYNVGSPQSALFTIADDVLSIDTIARSNNGIITLQWGSKIGYRYRVLFKSNLNDLSWQPLASALQSGSATVSWLDTNAPAASQRFYQVMEMP